MNKRQYVARRENSWRQFDALLRQLDKVGAARLTPQQSAEFSRLFRELCYDLALIRSRDWGQSLVAFLNELVGRGYNAFYRSAPAPLSVVAWFLAAGFPQVFRKNLRYFMAAALLFFGPLAATWAIVQHDPSLARRMVDPQTLEAMESMYGDSGGGTGISGRTAADERAIMAGFYTQHNVSIALDCFGRGILLAIGTAYTLLYNGIFLGAISGYLVATGHHVRFLSFVVSHGSFELTAIAISGGAGLILGDALLHPGQRTRLEALRERGMEAIQIACGAAAMLLVAALIEAFWSPSEVGAELKYAVGAVLWLLVLVYLATAGRWEKPR